MDRITRRAFGGLSAGALSFGTLAAQAHAKAPAARSAWPDAVETAQAIRSGKTTSAEAVKAAIDATVRLQPQLGFLVASDFDRAIAKAQARPASGPFAGVPFLIKDLDDYAGLPTRSGSRIQLGQPSATASTPFGDACDRAGFVVIGKSSTPEFGFLPTTEPVAFGPTRNPWDPARSSGGSSGGAAVAVAAGVVPIAHASDGGGSIRIPASCCGLIGLKPGRGATRRARAPHLMEDLLACDMLLARSVRDVEWAMGMVAANAPSPAPRREKGLRIAVVTTNLNGDQPHPDVLASTLRSARLCEELGHHVFEAPPPYDGPAVMVAFKAIWAYLARDVLQSARARFGAAADGAVEPWTLGLGEWAGGAAIDDVDHLFRATEEARRALDSAFGDADAILSPVLGLPALRIGELAPDADFDHIMQLMFDYVSYTPLHNLTGHPAMSLPVQPGPDGVPIGTMFAARRGGEPLLLDLARQLEQAAPWQDRWPGCVPGAKMG